MNNGIIILPDLIPGIGSNKMIGSYMYTETSMPSEDIYLKLLIHLAATTPVIFEDSKKGSKCMKIPGSKSGLESKGFLPSKIKRAGKTPK